MIPDEWQMLLELLRCALHGRTAPPGIESAAWSVLLRQARQHSVEHFLFPWLAANIPGLFSSRTSVTPDSAPAAWRALALEHLQATILRQQQSAAILRHFAEAHIAVIPLKGTWLSETVYDEPSQRSMVDIDLLVRKDAVEQAHRVLTADGYQPRRAQRDNRHICDSAYYHPAHRTFIELHWNVESEMITGSAIPDIEKIWDRTRTATLLGVTVQELPPEDQLAHLVQHILHHRLALSLRSYVDIALLLRKRGTAISSAELSQACACWKTTQAQPLILQMVAELFAVALPAQSDAQQPPVDPELLSSACQALFELPEASRRSHEFNLLKYRQASAAGKLRLIAGRIFMPRSFMALHYPFARHTLLLPIAWFLRACQLIHSTGAKIAALDDRAADLKNAAIREAILKKITRN